MKLSHLFLFALAHILIVSCVGKTEEPTKTEKATTTAPKTAKPTTAKPTTSKPTTSKPTTSKPTTSKPTTSKPTTTKPTTSKPTTTKPTTSKPTASKPTTKAPTTHSKHTPTASTTQPATTHKQPTHAPTKGPRPPSSHKLEPYDYDLYEGTGKNAKICIRLTAALQLNFTYKAKQGNNSIDRTVIVNFTHSGDGNMTTITGMCPHKQDNNTNASSLVIQFNSTYTLTFDFALNTSHNDDHWYVSQTTAEVDVTKLPNSLDTNKLTFVNTTYMPQKIELGYYLICNATINEVMKNSDSKGKNATLTKHSVAIEAFGDVSGGYSSSPSRCDADFKTNNIVPIAVGCALAALVLVVLIAYLIGRSRNSKSGYQSV